VSLGIGPSKVLLPPERVNHLAACIKAEFVFLG